MTAFQPDCAVVITREDFSQDALQAEIFACGGSAGALATFVGLVRGAGPNGVIEAIEVESYPGMTESSIAAIFEEAAQRWSLLAVRVVHRVGRLEAGEQIVYVGVSSLHRREAFAACEFIMDYLKTRAPLWKKELGTGGAWWVEARDTDTEAAERWGL